MVNNCFGPSTILLGLLEIFLDTSCSRLVLKYKFVVVRRFAKWMQALYHGLDVHTMHGTNSEADVGHFAGE